MKEITTKSSISGGSFPSKHFLETNLKRLYTTFAWGVYGVKRYLTELWDSYRFYPTGTSLANKFENFPDVFASTDGAADESLLDLAVSVDIHESVLSRIMFEWESKFLPKTSTNGIITFVQLFYKYELIHRGVEDALAERIADDIDVKVFSWYDSEISDCGNVYFYEDFAGITLFLEVVMPTSYAKYYGDVATHVQRLLGALPRVIVPTGKIQYVTIEWSK